MQLHTLGKPLGDAEKIVKTLRKELEKLVAKEAYAVNRVCPIDEQSAPDHHREKRKIYPMQPTDRKRVLLLKLLRHTDSID